MSRSSILSPILSSVVSSLALVALTASLSSSQAARADYIDHFATSEDIGLLKVPHLGETRVLVLPVIIDDLSFEQGNEAELFLKTYPDRIIKCKVDSILWATAQGQMPISGGLQTTTPGAGIDQRALGTRRIVHEVAVGAGAGHHAAVVGRHAHDAW